MVGADAEQANSSLRDWMAGSEKTTKLASWDILCYIKATVEKRTLLKQIGILLAALIVIVAIVLLMTFVIGGSNRMLTSEELAMEQTRIALEIAIKQTEVAQTSTAGLYLTLGVPFPTETPFIVSTSGALGKDTSTPTTENTGIGFVTTLLPPSRQTTPNLTLTPISNRTNDLTGWLGPTKTLVVTTIPTTNADSFWQGEWVAFYTNPDKMVPGFLTTSVSGKTISAEVFFVDGVEISLSGEISADEQFVNRKLYRHQGLRLVLLATLRGISVWGKFR